MQWERTLSCRGREAPLEEMNLEDLNTSPVVMEHIRDTKASLTEIEEDMKCLLKMEKEEKNMGEGFDAGALMGMLANKGVDPGIIAMLNDRRDRGDWGDSGMLVLLFLIILCGGGNGFGWGGRNDCGVERSVNAASDFNMLMEAIGTQGTRQEIAVSNLAQSFNCTSNQVQSALAGVDKQIALSQGSITGAVQNCCCNLGNQIQSTSCATQRAIENQGCSTRQTIVDQGNQTRGLLQDTRFLIQATASQQDNLVQQMFCQQNQLITDRFNALELRDMQRELDNKTERINDLKVQLSQAEQTGAILAAINAKTATS